MNNKYINIYNNFINLTRNKDLYQNFNHQDNFSDRLIFLQFHFAFFLKSFKNEENKEMLQEIYDYIFRQIELNIREIGYRDQSVNKKMKDYLNLFYDIIDKIDKWENSSTNIKKNILMSFVDKNANITHLIDYFDKYRLLLLNNTLNSYLKGVIKP